MAAGAIYTLAAKRFLKFDTARPGSETGLAENFSFQI